MLYFFLTLRFIVTKFCFSMYNYLYAYKLFLFIFTVAFLNVFFFAHPKFCVVYLNLTGYLMKA